MTCFHLAWRSAHRLLFSLFCVGLIVACAEDGADPVLVTDMMTDVSVVDAETAPDTEVDAMVVDADPAPDTAVDAEIASDAEVDAEPEPDAVVDAEVDAEPEPDAEVDAEPEPDAEVDAEPEPDAAVDAMVVDAELEPTCHDGIHNGVETDVDCGGSCDPCAEGQGCLAVDDCHSAVCLDAICQAARCGDGIVQGNETCDDGNALTEECEYGVEACTVCAADCTEQAGDTDLCGDGVMDAVEVCDDGNLETEECEYGVEACTVCAADCTEQAGDTDLCGDGVVDAVEVCDDGNLETEECEYGVEACTVCAADCTEQAGDTDLCGDGVVDAVEVCDDGNAVLENCAENQGPCEVCNEVCALVDGAQVPAPRVWDGEANDGRWETAANWHPNGVPGNNEWVVIGQNATVTADNPRCRNVTIEAGATLRQNNQVLACALTINGTFERIGGGVNPAGRSITVRGVFGSIPWIDTWNTAYAFHDGARFGNPNMAFRVRGGNTMAFILSEAGFAPLRAGAALDPNNWNDVAMRVDVSAYDLSNGSNVVLWDFGRHDGAFNLVDEIEVAVEDRSGRLDARLFWETDESRLVLRLASVLPLNDVQVALEPEAPTVLTPIRAMASTDHPTAALRYRWFVDGEPVVGDTDIFEATDEISRDAVVTVEVFAETPGGRSESVFASVTVANTPPTFTTIEILPGQPTIDDALSVNALVADLDPRDVAELTECIWQVWSDGWAEIGPGEALAACSERVGCEAGDLIRVSCQATDGLDISDPVASAPVTLLPADCDDADPRCTPLSTVPTVDALDYTFWHWPTNQRPRDRDTWPAYQREMHFVTGHYGLVFNEATGDVVHFGRLDDALPMATGRLRPNSVLDELPETQIRWGAGSGADVAIANRFLGDDGDTNGGSARLSEGGRFMNRVDLPDVRYAGQDDVRGLIEIASMPRHVTFTHRVRAEQAMAASSAASIRLNRGALAAFDQIHWLIEGRALRMNDAEGDGWLFVVYESPGSVTTLALTDDELIAERVADQVTNQQSISLLAAPISALNAAEVQLFLRPADAVTVGYTLLGLNGEPVRAETRVNWNEALGAYRINLGSLDEAGIGGGRNYDARPDLHNWYGRHQLRVDTHGLGPVAVPLAFYSNNRIAQSITSGVALFRDGDGAPIGVPIQMSKNWHDPSTGQWYRLYSQPVFSGIEVQPLELTMVSSRWGDEVYAASHAQLSLIGWNGGVAHWDESALGAFGESITYNPDRTYRSMVDDVRPFLVQAQDNNGRWNWTGNVGGADFLQFYSRTDQRNWSRQLSRVRTTYRSHGPNLTDVVYSGVSLGGAIQADITVQMGRTDDLVRTWYHFDYTFLEDVQYDRLAFFQMAADNYSDNGYARAAWGNADGVVQDRAVPDHGTTGYANDADRGIPLDGDSPWVMLYDNQWTNEDLPEHYADLAYVVREFEANIGGTIITTPHINLHRTNNRSSQIGFELGLPFEDGAAWCGDPCNGQRNFIPAGSTVRATVEYLVPPAEKDRYYGASDYLAALPGNQWRTIAMALELAVGNHLVVEPAIGQLRRTHPVELDAEPGAIATQFTLTGGRGYVPITVYGLMRHDGWQLQTQTDNGWVALDQSLHGNDFWQARFNGADGTYALTWNVPNRAATTYRVIWQP